MESKNRQQDHFQKPRNFGHFVAKSQPPMQYRTQSQPAGSQAPNLPFRSQNLPKAPMSSNNQATSNNRACFNCRETGHFIANCPYGNNRPAASAFSNSVQGPRPALSGANRVPVRSHPNSNNTQQVRQPQQSFARARVNHISAQEAQNAQGVVLGEFLVNSVLATVLFDSGASHSFISSSFVGKHKKPTVLLRVPLVTRMPRVDI